MTAIDVGSDASNRDTYVGNLYTEIVIDNPANATGKITSVEIWFNTNATGVKVGTFYGSGLSYTNRSYATLGNVTSGSKQTFTGLSIDVTTGDFIGFYAATGYLEASGSGYSGVWYVSGDKFGGGAITYTLSANQTLSLYGIGATVGWANITKVNGILSASISKVDGIEVASISKVNGIAV
jgi:hypothetical protein